MKITIGEVVNELMPYSRHVEINMAGDFPFIKADIGSNSKCTKAHIYVVQVDEHKYSICDYHDDLHGNRYIPTQSIEKPFVKEKKLIQHKFDIPVHDDDNEEDSVLLNVGYLSFLDHLYTLLSQYGVIRTSPKVLNKQITDRDVLPLIPRAAKALETVFKDRKMSDPKIKDLITIVKNPSDVFSIRGMKEKDVKDLENKFKNIGINLVIQRNTITDIHFEKIKTTGRG